MKKQSIVYLILVFIIISSALLNFSAFTKGHNWGDDFALYINQAKSLIENKVGELFARNKFTGDNSAWSQGPTLYPWGFPLLLTPVYFFFGMNFFVMKTLCLALFLLSLWLIFSLFKGKLGNKLALLIVLAFAFNPTFVKFNSDNVMSDIPYFFFALLTIFLIQRFVFEKKFLFNKFFSFALLGFLMFYSFYTRPNGIVLVPILFFCQFIESWPVIKNNGIWKTIKENYFGFIPYVSFLVFWLIGYNLLPDGSGPHFALLSKISFFQIYQFIPYYLKISYQFFGPFSDRIIFGVTVPFILWGVLKRWRKDYLYLIYAVSIYSIAVFWPERQGLRFLFSALPFLVYFLFAGLSEAQTAINKLYGSKIKLTYFFGFFIIFLFLWQSVLYVFAVSQNRTMDGIYSQEATDIFNFIEKNTKKDDLIIFDKPRLIRLITNRDAIGEYRFDKLLEMKGGYLIMDAADVRVWPGLDQVYTNKKFKLIFKDQVFDIYKIN